MRKLWICLLLLLLLVSACASSGMASETLKMPESAVVIEDEAFSGTKTIGEVILPEGIRRICSRAFADSSLHAINLPGTIEFIADDAFDGCGKIEFSVQKGTYAYTWCAAKNLIHAQTPEEYFTYEMMDDQYVRITGYTGADELVVIPDTISGYAVQEIGSHAFENCDFLKEVILPKNLTVIRDRAFLNCANLVDVVFPDGLQILEAGVFAGCNALLEADLPDSVTTIGEECFRYCNALESFHYPLNWTKVESMHGNDILYEGSIFNGCEALTEIVVPEGAEIIPEMAFGFADYLEKITLPSTLTEIGSRAFQECVGLTEITLPENLTVIRDRAFLNCANLVDVVFPDGLEILEAGVFAGCNALLEADLPDSVTTIGEECFRYCNVLESFHYPLNWVTVDSMHGNNILYEGSIFNGCEALTEIVVPEGIEIIPEMAFGFADYLEKITLPSTLKTIENEAFRDCASLVYAEPPMDLETIGDYAFAGCSVLPAIYLSPSVTNIGENAFADCPLLKIYCEWGSVALQYAIDDEIPYYYLTPTNVNYPTGTLYQGDGLELHGYVRASIPLTRVTAIIWNSDKSEIIRSIEVEPGVTDYNLADVVNYAMKLNQLPIGSYWYMLSAATEETEEVFAETAFRIVEPPLRAGYSNFVGPGALVDSSAGNIPFSGTIYANYPITAVTVYLLGPDSDSVAKSVSDYPGTKNYQLSNLKLTTDGLLSGGYKLRVNISAHGETLRLCEASFNLITDSSGTGSDYADEKRQEYLEFALNVKPGHLSPGEQADLYLGNLSLKDKITAGLCDYTDIATAKIKDFLTDSEYDSYMEKKYEAQILQMLDDMYSSNSHKQIAILTSTDKIIEKLINIRSSGTEVYYNEVSDELKELINQWDDEDAWEELATLKATVQAGESMKDFYDLVKVGEEFINFLIDVFQDHSRDLAVLKTIEETMNEQGTEEFMVALDRIQAKYQSQFGQTLMSAFEKIEEVMMEDGLELITDAVLKTIPKSSGGALYTLADTTVQLLFQLTGINKAGENVQEYIVLYTSVNSLNRAFENSVTEILESYYYENGKLPTNRQINNLIITHNSTESELIRLYDTMIRIDSSNADVYRGYKKKLNECSFPAAS